MKPRRLSRRFVPEPLQPAARILYAIAVLPFRVAGVALVKARNAVGYVRSRLPSPRSYWPDAKWLERAVLAPVLMLLQFHDRLLRALVMQSVNVRKLRGRRAIAKPIKVLHVTCSFDLGGTQRQILQLCEHQEASSFVHDAIEIFPEHNYLYRRDVRLDPNRYQGRTFMSRIMWRLTQNIATRSAQVVQVYKLARDFCALRPDVVVGWGHEISMIAFVSAAFARVPHVVFCIRTFNPVFGWTTPAMGRLLESSHRRMLPQLSGILTNSTPLRDDYANWLGIAPDGIQVCPNGIAVSRPNSDASERRDAVRRRFDIPSNALVVLNVGRFSPEKGHMTLLRANARVVARYRERAPLFLLCGDGPLLPDVRQFVEERGLQNVRFAGRIDDVDEYLGASDIFVMPSDFEGMPNAMMEAMTQGLPCVSTDRSGALDIARDGLEALYCPPGDDAGLANHLCTLIDSPAERARLGTNARARIKEFSVERMTKRFDACLESIVNRRPAVVPDVAPAYPIGTAEPR